MRLKLFAVIGFVSAGLMACEQPGPPTPQIRSVRAVTVERRVISETGRLDRADQGTKRD